MSHQSTIQIGCTQLIFRLVDGVDLGDSNRVEHVAVVLVVKDVSQEVVVGWHLIGHARCGLARRQD